jgi:hypothetical protein
VIAGPVARVAAVGENAHREVAVRDDARGVPALVDEHDRPHVALAHELGHLAYRGR